jgi:hypothetical protein
MSKTRNLEFSEGETWVIDATYLDSAGEALDLTGATVEWVVATKQGVAAIVTATTGNGLIVVDADPETGLATITVPYASHSAATPRGYLHESRVTLASGEVTVQFRGTLVVYDSLYVV